MSPYTWARFNNTCITNGVNDYLEARWTVAMIARDEVDTSSSVLTRLRLALVDVSVTIASLEPSTTLTIVRTTHVSARPAV